MHSVIEIINTYFLIKYKVRRRKGWIFGDVVNRRLVDESGFTIRYKQLPLIDMVTNIWIQTNTQQCYNLRESCDKHVKYT